MSMTTTAGLSDDASAGGPLTTFTCFPKFPPEVRLMIWKQVAPGNRKIFINPLHRDPDKLSLTYGVFNAFYETSFWNPVPDHSELVPAILQANQEARHELRPALEFFKCDDRPAPGEEPATGKLRGMLINPKTDWICLHSLEHFNSHIAAEQRALVELLAIDTLDVEEDCWNDEYPIPVFTNLRKIFAVAEFERVVEEVITKRDRGEDAPFDLVRYECCEEQNKELVDRAPVAFRLWKEMGGMVSRKSGKKVRAFKGLAAFFDHEEGSVPQGLIGTEHGDNGDVRKKEKKEESEETSEEAA